MLSHTRTTHAHTQSRCCFLYLLFHLQVLMWMKGGGWGGVKKSLCCNCVQKQKRFIKPSRDNNQKTPAAASAPICFSLTAQRVRTWPSGSTAGNFEREEPRERAVTSNVGFLLVWSHCLALALFLSLLITFSFSLSVKLHGFHYKRENGGKKMLKWDKKKNWETGQKVSVVGRSCLPFSIHLFFLPSLAPFLLFSLSPSTLAFVRVYSVCLLGWMRVSWWGNQGSRRWARSRGAEGGGHPFSKPWLAIVLKQSVNMRGKACQRRLLRSRWVQHGDGQGGERELLSCWGVSSLELPLHSAVCPPLSRSSVTSLFAIHWWLIQLLGFGRVSAVFKKTLSYVNVFA